MGKSESVFILMFANRNDKTILYVYLNPHANLFTHTYVYIIYLV